MKKIVKLTESDLHRVIKESVNNILSELDWRTYQSASDKAYNKADATKNKYEKDRRNKQGFDFDISAKKRINKQYNLPTNFDNEVRNGNMRPTQGQLKNATRRDEDVRKFYSGESEYKNGKWQDK